MSIAFFNVPIYFILLETGTFRFWLWRLNPLGHSSEYKFHRRCLMSKFSEILILAYRKLFSTIYWRKRLQNSYFSVNIANFLWKTFCMENFQWLLLKMVEEFLRNCNLTLYFAMSANGQIHFKNLGANAARFLKWVWPFYDIAKKRVKVNKSVCIA